MDSATILFFKCQRRDYSIAKSKKQTYIPKICSIFNLTGLRHLLNPKIHTSRRNAVFFLSNSLKLYVVWCVIMKYEDLVWQKIQGSNLLHTDGDPQWNENILLQPDHIACAVFLTLLIKIRRRKTAITTK